MLGEFGSRSGWGIGVGSVGFKRLGLARKIGIRGVGVERELGSRVSWGRGVVGVRGWGS